jgi:hypothetical protein
LKSSLISDMKLEICFIRRSTLASDPVCIRCKVVANGFNNSALD